MNTTTNWLTTITIADPARAAFWNSTVGTATFPILSPLTFIANLPIGPRLAYNLDIKALGDELKQKIAAALAGTDADPSEVIAEMETKGIPILADGCVVTCSDVGLLYSLLDFDIEQRDYLIMEIEYEDENE